MIQAALYWGPEEGPRGLEANAAIAATWDLVDRMAGTHAWFRREADADAVTRDGIPALLDEGRNRDDGKGEVIESLGRRMAIIDRAGSEIAVAVDGYDKTWKGPVRH